MDKFVKLPDESKYFLDRGLSLLPILFDGWTEFNIPADVLRNLESLVGKERPSPDVWRQRHTSRAHIGITARARDLLALQEIENFIKCLQCEPLGLVLKTSHLNANEVRALAIPELLATQAVIGPHAEAAIFAFPQECNERLVWLVAGLLVQILSLKCEASALRYFSTHGLGGCPLSRALSDNHGRIAYVFVYGAARIDP